MTAFAKFTMQGLLVLALVGLVTGIGWAGGAVTPIVRIDDLTEGPPSIAILNGGGIVPTILSDSAGEFLHFTLPVTPNALNSTKAYTEIWEDRVGGTLSDRLLITYIANSPVVDVQFASDPATITLPAGAFNVLNIVENGTFQFAGNLDFGENTIYQFQVRSDVADVPAPATLLLLGSGLAAVCSAGWRRCRRAE
jgi:hypothetical protein